jgi:hypothetical protein
VAPVDLGKFAIVHDIIVDYGYGEMTIGCLRKLDKDVLQHGITVGKDINPALKAGLLRRIGDKLEITQAGSDYMNQKAATKETAAS